MGKVLIVAEKPAAGADIAKVVGATEKHDGYMEGERYVVTWAIGHLITLKQPQEHDEKYKKWDLQNLPISFPISESLKVIPESSRQFKIIKSLIHRSDIESLINAGDAGREGYLIQEWIYRIAGCRLPKKVLWASSLTTAGIQTAMDNLKDNSLPEFQGILREAEARAEGDFILGFNYSPLLTLTRAYRQVLAYGRCQTPLLERVAARDEEIKNFKSVPYWCIGVTYNKGFKGILIDSEENNKKFMDKQDAEEAFSRSKGKGTVILHETEEKRVKAPLLYNLAKLQQDMGRKYSFSPDKTLEIAQALYEKHKILSYPRTDSQHLSMDVYDEITEHIQSCKFGSFAKLIDKIDFSGIKADKSYFNDLKVTDYHALIPTINSEMEEKYNSLSEDERKVFDTIVLSLIAIFYPEYLYEATKIIVEAGGNHFKSTGTTIKQLGFKSLLQDAEKQDDNKLQILPKMQNGDEITIDSAQIIERKTTPPPKYNDETIITVMEKYNIGTSATRAEIINKLQTPKRQFLVREKGKYSATELGKEYIRVVPQELKSPELTQQFEDNLQKVNAGTLSKEDFLGELLQDIRENITKFTSNPIPDEQKIGYAAAKAKEESNLGKCPKCGAVVKSGDFGAYCSGKCGMMLSRVRGKLLTDEQVKTLLSGKKICVTGLKKQAGGTYSAYFIPNGIEPYSYTTNDGIKKSGWQFKFQSELKKKKK